MLKIDRSTYSYYESGRISPDIQTILKIAKIFEIDYTEILDSENADICADFEESFYNNKDAGNKFFPSQENLTEQESALILSIRMLPNESKEEFVRMSLKQIQNIRREHRFKRKGFI